jgi:hypothetical protein
MDVVGRLDSHDLTERRYLGRDEHRGLEARDDVGVARQARVIVADADRPVEPVEGGGSWATDAPNANLGEIVVGAV